MVSKDVEEVMSMTGNPMKEIETFDDFVEKRRSF